MIPEWITLNKTGGTGSAQVEVTASKNNTLYERSAKLTVNAGELSQEVEIKQLPAFSVSFDATNVSYTGGRIAFHLCSAYQWMINQRKNSANLFAKIYDENNVEYELMIANNPLEKDTEGKYYATFYVEIPFNTITTSLPYVFAFKYRNADGTYSTTDNYVITQSPKPNSLVPVSVDMTNMSFINTPLSFTKGVSVSLQFSVESGYENPDIKVYNMTTLIPSSVQGYTLSFNVPVGASYIRIVGTASKINVNDALYFDIVTSSSQAGSIRINMERTTYSQVKGYLQYINTKVSDPIIEQETFNLSTNTSHITNLTMAKLNNGYELVSLVLDNGDCGTITGGNFYDDKWVFLSKEKSEMLIKAMDASNNKSYNNLVWGEELPDKYLMLDGCLIDNYTDEVVDVIPADTDHVFIQYVLNTENVGYVSTPNAWIKNLIYDKHELAVYFEVDKNNGKDREGTITISNPYFSTTILVKQAGLNNTLDREIILKPDLGKPVFDNIQLKENEIAFKENNNLIINHL